MSREPKDENYNAERDETEDEREEDNDDGNIYDPADAPMDIDEALEFLWSLFLPYPTP